MLQVRENSLREFAGRKSPAAGRQNSRGGTVVNVVVGLVLVLLLGLVYEPQAIHDGRCSVLRLGGQIELLTPEELKLAVIGTLTRRPDSRRQTRGLANRR